MCPELRGLLQVVCDAFVGMELLGIGSPCLVINMGPCTNIHHNQYAISQPCMAMRLQRAPDPSEVPFKGLDIAILHENACQQAADQVALMNRERFENPQRNNYKLESGVKIYGRHSTEDEASALLIITDKIADAAVLVAKLMSLTALSIPT